MTTPSVLEVTVYNGLGQLTRHNLAGLFLPGDVRPCHTLDLETLNAALIDMGVPIKHGSGRQDSLLAYSTWLKANEAKP
jgi:hypothetical protein